MKVTVISSSPNEIGLTNSCVEICLDELKKQGYETLNICLNKYNIKKCEACGERGWGTCLEKHVCRIEEDEFAKLQNEINQSDALIIITPVYFWEMSESAKTFFDRLRRCEAFNDDALLQGKEMICIACAGGSGNGTENCLNSMGILAKFLKMKIIENIGVTRFNFEEKKMNIIESTNKLINKGIINKDNK